ncbi:PEP-CTERM sorting domain-containing protein [Verrucomicrobium sp. BvORR106]|uniref:PEP-CTERM sorting domain-containing protein n=1 Tax=Verrucomicrobium sp. BvORR106 TaxID=1403819 RepID=UPI00056FF9DD|nr:PEP-CTERM sorting domain-containing protein [Verrucomicrobium sp. BvORR106]
MRFSFLTTLATLLLGASLPAAESVDIEFDNFSGNQTGTLQDLGPYYQSSVMKFTNVASVGNVSVDLRVTASAWGTYAFTGHLPDYSQNSAQPNGDLGLYYTATSYGSGGLHYTLEFFKGGTNFSTTFTVSQFDLLIYDVDGEARQTEAFRAYLSDGLTSYRLADSPNSVSASYFTNGVLFSGPGYNIAETDPSAAAILTYNNTNKITLDFESKTTGGSLPNGIFTAIDGDLSLLKGDTSDFGTPVAVPEPSGLVFIAAAGMVLVLRRKRRATAD